MALAMFDYVTELPHVDIDESLTHDFEVTGLLFNLSTIFSFIFTTISNYRTRFRIAPVQFHG